MASGPKPGSAADRVLRLLLKRHPIREDEVALALRMRPAEVALEVKRLAAQGLVVLESPGATESAPGGSLGRYLALTGAAFTLLGATSKERAEARKGKSVTSARDENDPAFQ